MTYLFLSYAVWLPAVLGYGTGLLNFLRLLPTGPEPALLLVCSVLGFAVLGTLANILNFFWPVSPWLSLVLLALGWLLFLLERRHIRDTVSRAWSHRIWTFILLVGLLLLLGALITRQGRDLPHDAGLYHLQSVKWITQSPLPFGLANLHWRFGFNSLWFSAAAALEVPGLESRSAFIINALLFSVYGVAVALAARRLLARDARPSVVFLLFSAAAWISMSQDGIMRDSMVGSAAPDFAVAILTLLSTYLVIGGLESKANLDWYAVASWLVATVAILVKLSSLPLLAGPMVLLGRKWSLCRTGAGLALRKLAPAALGTTGVLLAPWVARGFVASGYPAFPISLGRLPFADWTVPMPVLDFERRLIESWARQPGRPADEVLANWNWLQPWFDQFATTRTAREVLVVLLAGIVLWFMAAPRRLVSLSLTDSLAPAIAPSAGIAYWFLAAPDPRFGIGYLWALALVILASGASSARTAYLSGWPRSDRKLAILAVAVLVSFGLFTTVKYWGLPSAQALRTWPEIPKVDPKKANENVTQDGFRLVHPGPSGQCWDHALPCTPYFERDWQTSVDKLGRLRKIQVVPEN